MARQTDFVYCWKPRYVRMYGSEAPEMMMLSGSPNSVGCVNCARVSEACAGH